MDWETLIGRMHALHVKPDLYDCTSIAISGKLSPSLIAVAKTGIRRLSGLTGMVVSV